MYYRFLGRLAIVSTMCATSASAELASSGPSRSDHSPTYYGETHKGHCSEVEISERPDGPSVSVIFDREGAGVTRINFKKLVERGADLTSVVIKGEDEGAVAVGAGIQTFTRLRNPGVFGSPDSLVFMYNQHKPEFVIDELERKRYLTGDQAEEARNVLSCLPNS